MHFELNFTLTKSFMLTSVITSVTMRVGNWGMKRVGEGKVERKEGERGKREEVEKRKWKGRGRGSEVDSVSSGDRRG